MGLPGAGKMPRSYSMHNGSLIDLLHSAITPRTSKDDSSKPARLSEATDDAAASGGAPAVAEEPPTRGGGPFEARVLDNG